MKLPSVKTLTKLTSKVGKLDYDEFITKIFSNVNDKQRKCAVLVDKIYVKPLLQYHGRNMFGKVANNPESLATTVLGIMVKCLFGGSTILCKMIPVCKLNTNFLFEQVTCIIDIINSSNGQVFVVIVDNNRTNQKYFESFNRVKGKSWLTEDGLYLIYDYEHLLKSIRNNWLTEKLGVTIFEWG